MDAAAPEPNAGRIRFAQTALVGWYEEHPIPVILYFREDDPYAVTLKVDPADPDRDWTFARSILTEALAFRVPEPGDRLDVEVHRQGAEGEDLMVTLCASGRRTPVTFQMDTDEVQEFLRMTAALVPFGAESAAVDWSRAEYVFGLKPGQMTGEASPA